MIKSYFKVGSWTGISRVFGLLRDITTTGLLGTSSGLHDIFVVVLKIPNVFRRFFAEGAFSQAFIPIYNEYQEHKSTEEIKEFINNYSEGHIEDYQMSAWLMSGKKTPRCS